VALVLAGCGTGTTTSDDAPKRAAAEPAAHVHPTTPVPTFPIRAGERVISLALERPYTPDAPNGGTDDYRCFLLDPQLASTGFLTGFGFLPGNPAAVHHAILFRVPPDRVAKAEAADAKSAGDGWTCFGGSGVSDGGGMGGQLSDAPWLAAWAPGGKAQTYPDGFGVKVPAGTRFVLQVHYNLRASRAADQTGLRLRVTPDSPTIKPLETVLLPAPVELPCAPGESGRLCGREAAVLDVMSRFGEDSGGTVAGLQLLCNGDPAAPRAGVTQSCDRRVDRPTTVRAAAGHMHLLGKSIRITANPGTARERVLIDIPVWDFDNQGARQLAKPVTLVKGDVVRVACTHDAGKRKLLPSLADTPPRYVVWGEGTTDEMCLGTMIVTHP
jgi:hypothetical protein